MIAPLACAPADYIGDVPVRFQDGYDDEALAEAFARAAVSARDAALAIEAPTAQSLAIELVLEVAPTTGAGRLAGPIGRQAT